MDFFHLKCQALFLASFNRGLLGRGFADSGFLDRCGLLAANGFLGLRLMGRCFGARSLLVSSLFFGCCLICRFLSCLLGLLLGCFLGFLGCCLISGRLFLWLRHFSSRRYVLQVPGMDMISFGPTLRGVRSR